MVEHRNDRTPEVRAQCMPNTNRFIPSFLLSAIKWTYNFEQISKVCQLSIYLLISTDGTLTWSILHHLDLPIKNLPSSMELSVELESFTKKYHIGQLRWFQSYSSKCTNSTWGLSKIISSKILKN